MKQVNMKVNTALHIKSRTNSSNSRGFSFREHHNLMTSRSSSQKSYGTEMHRVESSNDNVT